MPACEGQARYRELPRAQRAAQHRSLPPRASCSSAMSRPARGSAPAARACSRFRHGRRGAEAAEVNMNEDDLAAVEVGSSASVSAGRATEGVYRPDLAEVAGDQRAERARASPASRCRSIPRPVWWLRLGASFAAGAMVAPKLGESAIMSDEREGSFVSHRRQGQPRCKRRNGRRPASSPARHRGGCPVSTGSESA